MALAKVHSDLPTPAKSSGEGFAPDAEPRFVHLLAEQWQAENDAAGPKARASATARFRHSDAGACARSVAYSALGVEPSDPMDLTGVWNTRLGTMVHDAWQAVIASRYPTAQIEPKVTTIDGEGAGHIDAVFTITMEGNDAEADSDPAGALDGEGRAKDRRLLDVDGGGGSARLRGDRGSVPEPQDAAGAPGGVGVAPGADPVGTGAGSSLPQSEVREPRSPGAGDPGGEQAAGGRSGDALPEGARVHAGEPGLSAEPDGEGVPGLQERATKVVCFELKTTGGFAHKMAVGERGAPQGPKYEHIVQAALNGKAVDADEVVIGYLSKEAISVNAAQRKKIGELGRFCAEWTLTRDEYLPYAVAEEARVSGILKLLDEGTLPSRKFPSPELPAGAVITHPPTGGWEHKDANGQLLDAGTFWACGYCKYRTVCAQTKPGRQPISEVAVTLGLAPEGEAA